MSSPMTFWKWGAKASVLWPPPQPTSTARFCKNARELMGHAHNEKKNHYFVLPVNFGDDSLDQGLGQNGPEERVQLGVVRILEVTTRHVTCMNL